MRTDERLADNHDGWEVQMLTGDGWKTFSVDNKNIYDHKESAVSSCDLFKQVWPKVEFRVYEALKEKK